MAEPLSAIPGAATDIPERTQPVRRPRILRRFPDVPESRRGEGEANRLFARLRSELENSYDNVSKAFSRTLERSRRQFRHVAHEHPLQVVLGVAVGAFIFGAALHIWRSHHD